MSSVSGIRLSGLASGMDTDTMVKEMLTADQEKIDTIKGEEQVLKWQQEAYRDIIGDVKSFSDKYLSMSSKDSILNSNNWNTLDVESTDSNVITATGTTGASDIDYTFDVKKLATGAKIETSSATNGKALTKSSKLEQLGADFTKGDIEFQIKTAGGTSQTITLTKEDTLDSMMKKMNEASNGNFKATFSEMTGEFKLESTQTGVNSSIQILDKDGKTQSKALGFLSSSFESEQKGSNAQIEVTTSNGKKISLDKESNNFEIDGIKYSVHSTGTSRVTSKQNVDKVVDHMNQFIEDYNKLMDDIYKEVIEKKNKDYKPLTDEQKKEMSEDEIKKWEEKAKEGLLKSDPELRRFMDDMQKAIFGENMDFMLSIGITSHSDYNKKGQLALDEDKFKKALQENGDEVYKRLAGNSDSVFENVNSTIKKYVGSSSSVFAQKAGIESTASVANNYYSEEIKKKEELVSELIKKMNKKEDSLYKKFGNLESTMNKLNAQMQQFFQA